VARTLGRTLPRAFYDRDARAVAPELLNKVLVGNGVAARLVEVEAYRADQDPGSHAFRGRTPRNASMFGAPGTLYVYFSYGNHWCMNAVCGPGEQAHAVLLRAAEPVDGLDVIRARRPRARTDRELCAGPGRLGQAFAIDRSFDGSSLLRGALRIVDDGVAPPARPGVSARVGLAAGKGDKLRLRYYVRGNVNVSRAPR